MRNQASAAKQAVVIGGSLGGLFAGLLLRSIRWDVDIYERSPHDLDSRGGGIVLQPEVLEAFRRASVHYDTSIGVWRERDSNPRSQARKGWAPCPLVSHHGWMLIVCSRRALPVGHLEGGRPTGDGRPQSKTVRSVAAQKTHNLSIFRIYRSHSQRVICTV
jgi:hypothetical protein